MNAAKHRRAKRIEKACHPERSAAGGAVGVGLREDGVCGAARSRWTSYFSAVGAALGKKLEVLRLRAAPPSPAGASLRMTVFFWMGAIALALTPVSAFAVGAGVKAEQKQKEMEAAVAKAANSPNADLTKLQCGNLVYAGNRSSICFADKFLTDVARDTTLDVGRNFVPVKLDAENVFDFPFCVWSGEQDFALTKKEREHLRKYLTGGGFILSSPGCSDPAWDIALRRELKLVFPEANLVKLPMSHPVFSTVKRITNLTDKKGQPASVEGLEIDGRLVMIYSKDGLNDVANAKGCCCCGGNMIVEAVLVNVNAFVYALLY